ncbi:MAG: hypothetical protein WA118_03945 [Carboxydocellales bacterium]
MYAKEIRKIDNSLLSELRKYTKGDLVEIYFGVNSEIRIKPHKEKVKMIEVLKKYAGILKRKDQSYVDLLKYRNERDHEDREVPDIDK